MARKWLRRNKLEGKVVWQEIRVRLTGRVLMLV